MILETFHRCLPTTLMLKMRTALYLLMKLSQLSNPQVVRALTLSMTSLVNLKTLILVTTRASASAPHHPLPNTAGSIDPIVNVSMIVLSLTLFTMGFQIILSYSVKLFDFMYKLFLENKRKKK